jgi:hypothetical protein
MAVKAKGTLTMTEHDEDLEATISELMAMLSCNRQQALLKIVVDARERYDRVDTNKAFNLFKDFYDRFYAELSTLSLRPPAGSVVPDGLPDPDPSALIVRLTQLSKPPYDSGVFGGPMDKAAAMLAKQAQVVEQKNAALRAAEEWLSGWASAEPYLSVIRDALSAAPTAPAPAGGGIENGDEVAKAIYEALNLDVPWGEAGNGWRSACCRAAIAADRTRTALSAARAGQGAQGGGK